MTFSDPLWLRALIALPVLLALEWRALRRARRQLERLIGTRADHALLGQRHDGERALGTVLRLGALALLALGAARPEWGREVVRRGSSGSDVVLAIDVSASMDARDVAPSRLGEARREALALVDRLEGSRIGVVAFAGDAVRLCPLTLDRSAARLTLESLSSATVSRPGTDLGRGLKAALRVLPQTRREEQAIVLWTDGEDLEQGARPAIQDAARSGVRTFAVGVGTAAGDVVPVLDAEGHVADVKRNESGDPVRSRLDEALLRELARRTNGAYFPANRPGGELPRLMSALGTVARAARGERLVERPVARFPLLALAAIALLAIERVRRRRRREPRADTASLHSERGAAAAALALALLLPAAAEAQSDWARGDRAFRKGRYAEAESLYSRRMRQEGPPEVRVNRATARALAGRDEEATRELESIVGRPDRSGREAGYNLGTLLGQRREYEPALAALRKTLERNPGDEDARWNYELLIRQQEAERRRPPDPEQQPQRPEPQPSGGGSQGSPPPPQPAPGNPPAPSGGQTPQNAGGGQSMSRAQAEQLLNALQELSRAEQQRQRRVRATQERPGRDW